jgi:hypothetical protein
MISQFSFNRLLWFVVAILSLTVAVFGVVNPSVYDGVIGESIKPGVFSQDILAVVLSVVLLLLAFTSRESQLRKRVIAHGILGFFFYSYGIYAIERVYNWLYPIYLGIFGLSLFVLIYGVSTVPKNATANLVVPSSVRILGAGYGILIAVIFNVIWFSQLVPLLRRGERIEFTYSIYIIDLSFVMPAFVIAAIMALRRHPTGLMGIPALFVLGAGILSPLALTEVLKPYRYGVPPETGEFWLYFVLTVLFMALAAIFLISFKTHRNEQ